MTTATISGDVFANWDSNIQVPFATGISGTVTDVISAIQGPVTALVVLWLIVTGILVMRGDVTVRTGISRIVSVSLVVGLVLSTTLYNEYIVNFFTNGIPSFVTSSLNNGTSTTGPDTFWQIFVKSQKVFAQAGKGVSTLDVVDGVLFALLDVISVIPVLFLFILYELTKILMDVVVCIGPFVLPGYLFASTRGVADRFVGQLIGLSILIVLVNIVLSTMDVAINTYFAETLSSIAAGQSDGWFGTTENVGATLVLCFQLVMFLALCAISVVFLPKIASAIGGGISVEASPLAVATRVAMLMKGK